MAHYIVFGVAGIYRRQDFHLLSGEAGTLHSSDQFLGFPENIDPHTTSILPGRCASPFQYFSHFGDKITNKVLKMQRYAVFFLL